MRAYILNGHHVMDHSIGDTDYSVSFWTGCDGFLLSALTLRGGGFSFHQKITPEEARTLAAMLTGFADEFEAREAALAKEYAEKMKEAA